MPIVTMNPAKITVQLLDINKLTQDHIFKLAQYIDAYEIETQMQESIVIDILRVTKTGHIELVITPKSGLTYDELSKHLDMVISYALVGANLKNCRWEIINITFQTEIPGQPSFIDNDNHSPFRAE